VVPVGYHLRPARAGRGRGLAGHRPRADLSPVPVSYSSFDFKFAAPDVITPGADHANRQPFTRAVDQAAAGDATGFADYVENATKSMKVPSFIGMNVTHCADGLCFDSYEDFQRRKALGEQLYPNFAGNELWHPLACVG
jgi:hypothetical protein